MFELHHRPEFLGALYYEVEHEIGRSVFLLPQKISVTYLRQNIEFVGGLLGPDHWHFVIIDRQNLRREPQWTNVKHLLAYREFEVGLSDRLRILDLVDEQGSAELSRCASLCRETSDAVGAVLALVAEGYLALDLAQTLSLTSLVSRSCDSVQDCLVSHHRYNGAALSLAVSIQRGTV
jgi:hypothetical protein